jgi:RHS repeat-associated protein/uncharacterized repeat protein (TIGR01451 family)
LEGRWLPSLVTWDGGAGTLSWNDPANWSGDALPGANDDVRIDISVGGAIFFNSGTSRINSLTDITADLSLSGGIFAITAASTINNHFTVSGDVGGTVLTVDGTLTISGSMAWSGATMNGAGTTDIASGATLDITGQRADLDNHQLDNDGAIHFAGSGAFSPFQSTINNRGLFEIQNDLDLGSGGVSTFNNSGTLRKTASTGSSSFSFDLVNTGTVEILAGSLSLEGVNTTSTGVIQVAAGASLAFRGGTSTVDGTVSGNGDVLFRSGNATINGTYDIAGNTSISGGIADFGTDVRIPTLNLTSGILEGAGTVTVTGSMAWTGGVLATTGPGRTEISAGVTLDITGADFKNFQETHLDNDGTIHFASLGPLSGGAVINNRGLFEIQSDQILGSAGEGRTFNNSGTLRETVASTATSHFELGLANTGTVEILSGSLALEGVGLTSTGAFQIAGGANLAFEGGANTLAGTVAGNGDVIFDHNVTTITGTYDIAGTTFVIGGTGDAAEFDTDVRIPTLNLSGGALQGTGTVTVTGSMVWTGGIMQGTGTTEIPTGVTLDIVGPDRKDLVTRHLDNDGTVHFAGTAPVFDNDSTINNRGLFEIDNDQELGSFSASNHFNNNGTLRKVTASTGTTLFQYALTNTGTVEIQAGSLLLQAFSDSTNSGAFEVAEGTRLEFSGNTTLGGTVSGNGDVAFLGSSVTITGAYLIAGTTFVGAPGASAVADFETNVRIPTLTLLSGSSLQGAGIVTVTGSMSWIGGEMAGAGITEIALGATLDITGPDRKDLTGGRHLDNDGTVDFAGTSDLFGFDPVVNNRGLFEIQTGSNLNLTGTFTNNGTLRKTSDGTSAIGQFGATFTNNGTIEVSAGTLSLQGAFSNYSGSTVTLTGGRYIVHGNGAFQFNDASIQTNAADILLEGPGAAILDQNGHSALAGFVANAGGGGFTLENGATFTSTGAFNNTGGLTVGPGSIFSSQGDYTQTSAGILTVEIGGSPASGQFGMLTASGQVSLAGTLSVRLVNGFGPSQGQNFQIMTFAGSTGSYSAVLGLSAGRQQVLQAVTNPTNVTLSTLASVADLAVSTVTPPANAIFGDTISIPYTVQNLSSAVAATGSWFDSLYLSSDSTLDPGDLLIGRVQHFGDVAPSASYSETLTAPLPGAQEGSYQVIVVADSRGLVPDSERTNNIAASSTSLSATITVLTLGQTFAGTIADAQDRYFRVDVSPGSDVQITASLAVPSEAQLFARYGAVPDLGDFDQTVTNVTLREQHVLLSGPAGAYYVLLHALAGASTGQAFSLDAESGSFALNAVSPNQGSNAGQATVALTGSGFSPTMTASLRAGSVSRNATRITFQDSGTAFATFDLTGLATGTYDILVQDGSRSSTALGAFTVTAGNPGQLRITVVTPEIARDGVITRATVEVTNLGDTDVPAPILSVTSDVAQLRLPDGADFDDDVQFLAINPSAPAGIIPPRGTFHIDVLFRALNFSGTFSLAVHEFDPSTPIDWPSLRDSLRPASITPDGWNAVFANFEARVGNTIGQYQAVLDDAASYLSQLGQATDDISRLLSFLFAQADNAFLGRTLASSTDATAVAPGLPLELTRTALQPISRRYQLGPFGRGWSGVFDTTLQSVGPGLFVVEGPDGNRLYQQDAQDPNVSRGLFGEEGVLVGASADASGHLLGTASLVTTDGRTFLFAADGTLQEVSDSNNNTIRFGYTNGRLTSLVHSDGDRFTLDYNVQGRVSRLTDQAGRITTYSYDTSGEHLLTVAGPFGTTQYTYETGTSAARLHALTSVTRPDGAHTFYSYDDEGRLIHTESDGGARALTFSYDDEAQITVSDATGAGVTFTLDAVGHAARIRSPNNELTQVQFDQNQQPVRSQLPGGLTLTGQFNAQGFLSQQTDPAGRTLGQVFAPSQTLSFGGSSIPTAERLTTFTNALGVDTRLSYDSQGNLLAITYADGSFQQFEYDAAGNVNLYRNRRGQVLRFTYNARGQVLRRDHDDGSHEDFTYDDRGNLLTATDASGTTAYVYDTGDRLTRVTYPDGRFLAYTYDAGGRLTQLVDQDGFTVNYAYDVAGRLLQLTDGSGASLVSYTYDQGLARETHANGTFTTYEYDPAGRVTHLVNHAPDGSVNSRFDYAYDDLARRVTVGTLDGQWTYEFDAVGQLSHAVFGSTNPDLPNEDLRYEYDAAGNRIRTIQNGETTDYTANNLDQYTQIGTASNTYDADGNLIATSDSAGSARYGFDDQGRLVRVTTTAGTWTYEYDALGHRIASVHNGQRTEYLVDPRGLGQVVGDFDSSGPVARYVYGRGGLEGRIAGDGSSAFYDFDALGSTAGLTDASGAYVNRYRYLPFGEALTSPSEALSNPFSFEGQLGIMQGTNGLAFMRARYYQADSGRFISPDPIRLSGGTNLYRYVDNQPTRFTDPSGLEIPPPTFFISESLLLEVIADETGAGATDKVVTDTLVDSTAEEVGGQGAQEGSAVGSGEGGGGAAPAEPGVPGEPGGPAVPGIPLPKMVGLLDKLFPIGGTNAINPLVLPINPITVCLIIDCDGGHTHNAGTRAVRSQDPNDLIGPAGFGDAQFVSADQTLPYTIDFENLSSATAPAQQVVVTEQLDSDLDFTSFEFGDFGFGDTTVHVPAGLSAFHTRIDARSTLGVFVDVTMGVNLTTGLVTWTFVSEDPQTLDIPADPLAGFLPPDQTPPLGEGFVSYRVRPRRAAPTGTRIDAQAQVVFDNNPAIDTPASFNTIDSGHPISAVAPLPATTSTSFTVSWSGQDDAGGSGIAVFDVFVSDNGGAFAPFLTATAQTSATFNGQVGHTYGFLSVATDNVGQRSPTPNAAQATTRVVAADPFVAYVTSLYHVVLNRNPPAAEIAPWVVFLHSGGTRAQVAQVFWESPEHRGIQVDGFYQTFLHRLADPGGRAGWVGVLVSGMTEIQVEHAFLASPEYQHAHRNDTAFIDGLYADALGRQESGSEQALWIGFLRQGGARDQAEQLFLTSLENTRRTIDGYYAGLLRRQPDLAGEAGWINALLSGSLPREAIAEAFLASTEFLVKASAGLL